MNILNNKKPTITDVAKKAGVSIKTVSRVVNKEANVSDGTREKVQTAIDLLNYQPNISARHWLETDLFQLAYYTRTRTNLTI